MPVEDIVAGIEYEIVTERSMTAYELTMELQASYSRRNPIAVHIVPMISNSSPLNFISVGSPGYGVTVHSMYDVILGDGSQPLGAAGNKFQVKVNPDFPVSMKEFDISVLELAVRDVKERLGPK